MNIYFGAVNKSEVQDEDGMYVAEDAPNHMFYYGVEYGTNPGGTDEVLIFDGIERSVPIDIESVPALITALARYYKVYTGLSLAEQIKEQVEDVYAEESII